MEDIKISLEKFIPEPNKIAIAVLPTEILISWLHDRGDFVSQKINGEVPKAHGTICEPADSWLYWNHDFRKQSLGIQRVRSPANVDQICIEVLASLLFDALKEAYRWKLAYVHVWNPSPDSLEAMHYLKNKFDIEVESKEQSSSIPSLRLRDSERARDLTLLFNEHYAWS